MSTMKFCSNCNNLLYPKEDKERKILLNACRTCDYQEVAENNCVHREEIHRPVIQILKDVVSDPTYPRTRDVSCPVCQYQHAVVYQATVTGQEETTRVYACCNPKCGHHWSA